METRTHAVDSGRRPYRISSDQFERMIETGLIPDGDDLELVRGRLYRRVKKEPHNFVVGQVAESLRRILPDGFNVREEKSLRHDPRTLPEPDVVVARGRAGEYRPQPPSTSEVPMIVEVCHNSRKADYHDKLRIYATAGVPLYWIVDLHERKIDVYSEPRSSASPASYARLASFSEDSSTPVALDGREIGRIVVKDLLPPL